MSFRRVLGAARRIALALLALYLFVLGLSLMVEGAAGLEPLVRALRIAGPVNSLGMGWLTAYLVLSGSPVAAMALTLLDGGLIGTIEAYTMITGSRLGASLVVLLIGLIYTLRGHGRRTSTYMGALSLVVSGLTQLLALPIGVAMLTVGIAPDLSIGGGRLSSFTDLLVGEVVEMTVAGAAIWGGTLLLFVVGLGVIVVALSLFDRALPQPTLPRSRVATPEHTLYRPAAMLAMGMAVTLLSMSVSVSLSLLVPLSARGYVRRENVIPYIMGANITTFVDTLFAAALVPSPAATTVVLTHMLSVFLVAVVVLSVASEPFERATLSVADRATASGRNTAVFTGVIVLVPLLLMLL